MKEEEGGRGNKKKELSERGEGKTDERNIALMK